MPLTPAEKQARYRAKLRTKVSDLSTYTAAELAVAHAAVLAYRAGNVAAAPAPAPAPKVKPATKRVTLPAAQAAQIVPLVDVVEFTDTYTSAGKKVRVSGRVGFRADGRRDFPNVTLTHDGVVVGDFSLNRWMDAGCAGVHGNVTLVGGHPDDAAFVRVLRKHLNAPVVKNQADFDAARPDDEKASLARLQRLLG